MNHLHTIVRAPEITRRPSYTEDASRLAVSVVFTDMEGTAAALQSARAMARDLGAVIRLEVPVVVPQQLPLDRPMVPVNFTEQALVKLVSEMGMEDMAPSIHVYLCRDRLDTLAQILQPESLVVIGGRKHWWPTEDSRLAKALVRRGNRVALVDAADTAARNRRDRR